MGQNDEYKLILLTLEKLDNKMDKLGEKNAQQDLEIKCAELNVKSCQTELTEHKTDHKWNNVFTLSVASFFSGVIALVVGFFKGGK